MQQTITAVDLKIGDTFRKQGVLLEVVTITHNNYTNGTKCITVGCTTNGGSELDSFCHFKLTTKIKLSNKTK